jgi:hypothetical protein
MPQNPHEYVVRREQDGRLFELAVLFLREFGEVERWGRGEYVAYDTPTHHYWTMGHDLSTTVVLNRKPTEPSLVEELSERAAREGRPWRPRGGGKRAAVRTAAPALFGEEGEEGG